MGIEEINKHKNDSSYYDEDGNYIGDDYEESEDFDDAESDDVEAEVEESAEEE